MLYRVFTISVTNKKGLLSITLKILKIIAYSYIYFYKTTKYPSKPYFLIRPTF